MSKQEQCPLPMPVMPLPEVGVTLAIMAEVWSRSYKAVSSDEMGLTPMIFRAVSEAGAKDGFSVQAYAFPEFTAGTKSSVGMMLRALEATSLGVAFVHEAWVTTGKREVLEGSGVIMPPRVCADRRDALVIQLTLPKRRLWWANMVEGEGKQTRREPDLLKWAKWMEQEETRIVRQDQLTEEILVSTVFLGMDHNWGGSDRPLLFETMVFWPGNELDECCWRYSTYEEAEEGHALVMELVKAELKKDSQSPIENSQGGAA